MAGFSQITRQTLEEAARQRKTPGEVIQQNSVLQETSDTLKTAIRERACVGKTINVSYDEMKDAYGAEIFGSSQPKRAIDNVIFDLKHEGITVQTGKTVRYRGRTRNGFSIYQAESIDNLVAGLP